MLTRRNILSAFIGAAVARLFPSMRAAIQSPPDNSPPLPVSREASVVFLEAGQEIKQGTAVYLGPDDRVYQHHGKCFVGFALEGAPKNGITPIAIYPLPEPSKQFRAL